MHIFPMENFYMYPWYIFCNCYLLQDTV